MKYIIFFTVFIILFVLLTSCSPQTPQDVHNRVKQTESGAIFLGTVDGCRMWRVDTVEFRTIYFVKCPNSMSTTSWKYGKRDQMMVVTQ